MFKLETTEIRKRGGGGTMFGIAAPTEQETQGLAESNVPLPRRAN